MNSQHYCQKATAKELVSLGNPPKSLIQSWDNTPYIPSGLGSGNIVKECGSETLLDDEIINSTSLGTFGFSNSNSGSLQTICACK